MADTARPLRSADYTRNAATLPALYQDDAASFSQVDAYLGLADDLNEGIAQVVEDLAFGFGPDAALSWPPDVPLGAGPDPLLSALTARYDALTEWFAFEAPSSWGMGEQAIAARRTFLARASRIWRRRGTPRGFLDWFCLYFGYEQEDERPVLLEHFKVPGGDFDPEPYTATLFVPNLDQFTDYHRRLEAGQFARWYAPAHVLLRVCFIAKGKLATRPAFASPATLAPDADHGAVTTYSDLIAAQAKNLRELACEIVSLVDHANGIHIYGCGLDDVTDRSIDHLEIGRLPTTGSTD
jgi:hypothetical protein